MAVTRTFSIIKPDATRRNLTGAVTAKLEEAGLRVVASKRIHMTREQAEGYQSGRIDQVLPKLFPDLSKHSIFAAGSPEFVQTCASTVKLLGAQPELIHTEGFFSQQVAEAKEDDPFKLPF